MSSCGIMIIMKGFMCVFVGFYVIFVGIYDGHATFSISMSISFHSYRIIRFIHCC